MRQLPLAMVMIVVAGWSQTAAAQSKTEELIAESNPAVQAQIKATAIAFLSGRRSESEIRTNWKGFRELEKLKGLAGGDEQLVKQLTVYAIVEQRPDEMQAVEALLALELLHVKPSITIRVLAPYLDSDDKLLRGFVRDWFEVHATHGARGAPRELAPHYKDYADYMSVTLNADEEYPTSLVDYMYEQSPGQALMALQRANPRKHAETVARLRAIREKMEADRRQPENQGPDAILPPDNTGQREKKGPDEILVAEKIVSHAISLKNWENGKLLPEAREQLAELAENDQWWVRRYVAEIMRRHRELRLDDVLQKLREDSDESVSKAAKAVRN